MAGETRTRILDGARALFAEQGVGATSIVQIEARAGLSPGSGSFYRHFPDKDALLDAVVARELALAVEVRASRTANDRSLEAHYRATLDELDRMADLITLLAREGRQRAELFGPVREVLAEGGARAEAELLRARQSAAGDAGVDLDAVATVAMFALIGHHMAEYFFGVPVGVDRTRFTQALAALVEGDPRRA